MVRMDKLDDTTWAYTVVDPSVDPPAVLLTGRILANSPEECLENIAKAFRLMGTCIKKKNTSVGVEVFDAENNEIIYADMSPDLENVDQRGV